MSLLYLRDNVVYEQKPNNKNAGAIKKRLGKKNNQKKSSVQELAQDCLKYSIAPIEIKQNSDALNQSIWKSQQIIMLDIDNKECNITPECFLKISLEANLKPCFIYTTLGHNESHAKFRAVYRLNAPIRDLFTRKRVFEFFFKAFYREGISYVDKRCSDPGRIFYRGKTLVYEDYNASVYWQGQYLTNNDTIDVQPPLNFRGINTYGLTNIKEYQMRHYLKPSEARCDGALDRLALSGNEYDLPLDKILKAEAGQKILCLFHEESNPSANILINKYTGKWQYYCHGCGTKTDALGVLSALKRMSYYEAREYAQLNYGLNYKSPEEKEVFQPYKEFLYCVLPEDPELEELHKYVRPHIDKLWNIIDYGKNAQIAKEYKHGTIFFASYELLRKILLKRGVRGCARQENVYKVIRLFVELGIINIVSEKNITELNIEPYYSNKKKRHVTVFCIPFFNREVFLAAQERVKELKNRSILKKSYSRDTKLLIDGQEDTARVFSQDLNRGTNKRFDDFYKRFKKVALNTIKKEGYATEKEICRRLKKNKIFYYINDIYHCLPVLLKEYGLSKIRVNKNTRATYSVKPNIKSNSFIIIPTANTLMRR